MAIKFVSSQTSSLAKKDNLYFPKLGKGETAQITFLTKIKDFDPKNIFGEDPARMDYVSFYDDVSKSGFRISESVSETIRNQVLSKKSIKETKRTAAVFLIYKTDDNKKIVGFQDLYILQMGSDKMKTFSEIEETERMDNPKFSLHDIDYMVKCEDPQYNKWIITAKKTKAFDNFPEDVRKELYEKARVIVREQFPRLGGKELDEAELIEKFALDIGEDDSMDVNPMAQSSEDDFSHLKSNSTPFNKK